MFSIQLRNISLLLSHPICRRWFPNGLTSTYMYNWNKKNCCTTNPPAAERFKWTSLLTASLIGGWRQIYCTWYTRCSFNANCSALQICLYLRTAYLGAESRAVHYARCFHLGLEHMFSQIKMHSILILPAVNIYLCCHEILQLIDTTRLLVVISCLSVVYLTVFCQFKCYTSN
jgi:hypothetical protein